MLPDFPWKNYLVITVLIGLFVFVLGILQFCQQKRLARVIFLDVGEGNAVLIQNYSQNILIDGGPDKTILEKLDQFIPFYRRKLDLIISLSSRKQSLVGLISVAKNYRVNRILDDCASGKSEIEGYWQKEIKNKNVVCLKNKMIVKLSGGNYLEVFILSEQNKRQEGIAWLKLGAKNFLLSPGICQNGEKWLINNLRQPVNVWQIPRQGIKGAVLPAFLRKFKPETAVIQSGRSRFKKINWQTIKTLDDNGIKIKRTDLDGDIIFNIGESKFSSLDRFKKIGNLFQVR